jgi:thiopeptide-type bacteriocin biosynthesis protein
MTKYDTYNRYVIRKPLFSYDILFSNKNETKNLEDVVEDLINDQTFVTSIYWSSPDLFKTILSYKNRTLDIKKIPKLLNTLKKYAIRSSTRCTPYGTIAGVGLVDLKNINKKQERLTRKARVDMDFFSEFRSHIENNNTIKKHLSYKVNNTFTKIHGQYRYQELIDRENGGKYQNSSMEINEYIEKIQELEIFTSYKEICNLFSADFGKVEIAYFIDELIDNQFLVSNLPLSLTSDNILKIKSALVDLLKNGVMEAANYLNIVKRLEQIIHLLEETQLYYLPIREIDEIKEILKTLNINKTHLFHVDLKHFSHADFEPDEKMLNEITVAIGILHKLGRKNSNHIDLESFKNVFNEKYESREIPLTEVLDTEFGIGFPANLQIGHIQSNTLIEGMAKSGISANIIEKQSSYLDILLDIIENEKEKIIYVEKINFETLDETPIAMQNFCVIGYSIKENFFLQNISTSGANSILGRFAYLDSDIENLCKEISEEEQKNDPDVVFAEIIFIPEKRTANIARRPQLSEYEIPILVDSDNDNTKQILLNDIMVSIDNGTIILKSKSLGKRIIPKLSNAHNYYKNENPAYKFLSSISSQNQININFNVDYKQLKKRFVPRMQYKNIILHRASWIMNENDIDRIRKSKTPLVEVKNFLTKWQVSQYVVLVQGDNELFLDTENETYLTILVEELRDKKTIQLSEWLEHDSNEKFIQQIVLPLKNKTFHASSYQQAVQKESHVQRSFAPGSEWLYLKIYCNSNISDYLLATEIKPFLDQCLDSKMIRSAFFIRYTDPHYHLRLRMHLVHEKYYAEAIHLLNTFLESYFQKEIIWKIQIESYQRELERYDPYFMLNTEKAFFYDSTLILSLLQNETFVENDDIKLFSAVKNVEDWLSLFRFSLQEKLDFCKKMEKIFLKEFSNEFKIHINSKFRLLKNSFYLFFENSSYENEFNQRNEDLKNVELSKEKLSSYIHMSLNRWFSSEQRALELMTYSFASKYYSRIISQLN